MTRLGSVSTLREQVSLKVFFSYGLDWVLLIIFAIVSAVLGTIEPNKRPFSIVDPDISFPFTEHEAVPPWLLIFLNAVVPVLAIALVSLVFIPGTTVPRDTPKLMVWKRKLWELHVGWLGLALSLVSAWFFTNGSKNLFGKPRPDLLARCQPDLANATAYVVGGFAGRTDTGQLYSAGICQTTDSDRLDDGFRSYPSGHSSSAAAGLVYLSLFLASKFAVLIPFAPSPNAPHDSLTHSAFPSRSQTASSAFRPARMQNGWEEQYEPNTAKATQDDQQHNAEISSLRRQAAAPPIYLLIIVLIPFCVSLFIAASRWYDFRHHGFDILFGYLIGVVTAIFSFRYYHLPISQGAGWAWGPRSRDRAFWAGVGRLGYAGDETTVGQSSGRYQGGFRAPDRTQHFGSGGLTHRAGTNGTSATPQDIEASQMETRV